MVHGIPADDQITNVQFCIERAGNAGIDDMGYAIAIAEDLGTEGCIDLAHTTLDNHCR